jgi:drug/metabolite transporter (DMT)-like permease
VKPPSVAMAGPRRRAEGLLFAATLVWGSTFLVMKNAATAISPVGFVFFRFLVATLLCAVLFGRRILRIRRSTLKKGLFLGLFLFLGILCQVWGLQTTSASNSAFLTGMVVITVPLLESALGRKRPSSGIFMGALLALGGLGLLSGLFSAGGVGALRVGDGLTLLGTLAWTVQVAALDRVVEGEDAFAISFLQFLTVTVLAGAAYGVTGHPFSAGPVAIPWFAVLYTGIAGTFLAFTVQTVFQFHTSPARAVLIYSFEPVFALLFALVLPGPDGSTEVLTWVRAAGCLLVFTGMLAAEFLPLRARAAS